MMCNIRIHLEALYWVSISASIRDDLIFPIYKSKSNSKFYLRSRFLSKIKMAFLRYLDPTYHEFEFSGTGTGDFSKSVMGRRVEFPKFVICLFCILNSIEADRITLKSSKFELRVLKSFKTRNITHTADVVSDQ